MISDKDLQTLVDYRGEFPALSLYFHNDLVEQPLETNKLRLRALLNELPSEAALDVQAVRNYFENDFNWQQNRSGVIFSNQQQDFFQAFPLDIEVPDQTQFTRELLLSTLICLMQTTSGYGVALVDQQQARLMAFQMGELVQEEVFEGDEIQRIKHGGGSHPTGRWRGDEGEGEHVDTTRNRNLREAAQQADDFFSKTKVRRIFLGGTEPTVAAFRDQLTKSWQSLISGTFTMDINANPQEVKKVILKLGNDQERKKQDALIEKVVTETAKGKLGVLRTEDVLGAVREGRVQTLLLNSDFHQAGYRCTGCGYLTVQEMEDCPFCGSTFQQIDDTAELAVRDVLNAGGSVELLSQNPALQEHGGIGALLRY